jgi:hypothetical protein
MVQYEEHGVSLTKNQQKRLMNCSAITLQKEATSGPDKLMLTKRQANKLRSAREKGKGLTIQFTKAQINKNEATYGEGFMDDVVSGAKQLFQRVKPMIRPTLRRGVNMLADKARSSGRIPPELIPIAQQLANAGINFAGDQFGFGMHTGAGAVPMIQLGSNLIKHKKRGGSFIPVGDYA